MSNSSAGLTRDVPLEPGRAALLIVDVQNYCCDRDGGAVKDMAEADFQAQYGEYFERLENQAIPNMQSLINACREVGVEVIYTVIEALTRDGRDRGLDYKITGFLVPRGSRDGKVIDAIAPGEDEIVLPKSASSVFNATNIEYVLRNLGVERLAICGVYTDQCVESAVRDACDRGFLVTLVPDACATTSQSAHDNSLKAIKGYCRTLGTAELVAELKTYRQRRAS
ncbi:MAG: cysteine hydrolase [Rhodospirillaceae bacterium]|nr:cysteine hydrolase [Rhodospirillaceae bacterium]MBT3885746.1 cysteine hydrolase [Rhodospirillaceae bacterium]MBT3927568.1 cysteine hydrolase [Rhodospirillaceae bacterium]MBT4426138.1 cysteine hydrolase [Rhodospirillaceae bacterium]MBT5037418.1 cysteine hydrolase [Rhodospirillaceae bacterium]